MYTRENDTTRLERGHGGCGDEDGRGGYGDEGG
jgi:hypothetical protein